MTFKLFEFMLILVAFSSVENFVFNLSVATIDRTVILLDLLVLKKIVWCNAFYLLHKQINSHESRFNLFGLLTNSTQRICLVARAGTNQ